jgi:hypothetical protein
MRKILLMLTVFVVIFSGCNSMEIIKDGLESKTKSESGKGSINLDYFKSETGSLCKHDDTENDINAEKVSEDINITERAEEHDITEYDVIIDGMDRSLLPQSSAGGDSYELLEEYKTGIPWEIDINLIYDIYNVAFDYVLVMGDNVNIRSAPSTSSQITGTAHSLEKLNVVAKVKGQYLESYGDDIWYQVAWNDIDTIKQGYIFGSLADVRTFDFSAMLNAVKHLRESTENHVIAYISNYKNRNGEPPLYNGAEKDKFGTNRYQSAPAYYEAFDNSKFRYIPDGMLVCLLDETDSYFYLSVPSYNNEKYYVPKQYISIFNTITELKQVVVIDRTNQNQAVFQYFDDKWQIVSYTYATTGGDENYRYPTNKGCFLVMDKREKLEYIDDASGDVLGYAPYAVRFSGSSYLHGIPVEYEITDNGLTDPGLREYIFTLGTFPRTNGSVRNYTSHAQFLYEWLVNGESAVIVID